MDGCLTLFSKYYGELSTSGDNLDEGPESLLLSYTFVGVAGI